VSGLTFAECNRVLAVWLDDDQSTARFFRDTVLPD